jgi:outer membrane protein TolC
MAMRLRSLLLAAGPLLLACCTVGPDYVKPSTDVPTAYKESPSASYGDAGTWQPARPSDDAIRSNWWEVFGDPQLDFLEQQVSVANRDLKAAEAHFREARDIVKLARADFFPTIGVGSNVASLKDSSYEPYTPSRNLRATGEFLLTTDLSYEVDVWGRIHRQVTRAERRASAATERIAIAIAAYYDEAQQQDEAVDSAKTNLQLFTDRYVGGRDSFLQVTTAQSP